MKRCVLLLFGAALWAGLAVAARAQERDPADLLPAQTLAYLELRQPEQFAREVAALMKGSALEDMPQTLARFRAQHPNIQSWMLSELAAYCLFVSPETVAEAGRLQGGAVAVTGFSKDNEPEVVGLLLGGKSHAPTFVLRAYLSIDQVRIVEEVEKTPIYQQSERVFQAVGGGGPPAAEAKLTGPAFALLADAVVIGSTKEAVKDVLQRYHGKPASPALSSAPAFKEAARLRGPGLFAYADCAGLTKAFDNLKTGRPLTDFEWSALKAFINAQALRHAAASLVLKDGGLEFRTEVSLVPGQTSPFFQLLADQPVHLDLLHATPKNSLLAVTTRFPDGVKAWQTILGMADTLAKLDGKPEQLWPSKAIGELEKQLKLNFGKDVLGKIAGLAVALERRGDPAAEGMHLPLVIVEATDEAAARGLEQLVPQFLGLMSRAEIPVPASEKVEGYQLRSLPGDGLPWGTSLYYGHHNAILVFGQDRKSVVAALQGAEKKGGLLGEPKVAAAVRPFDKAIVVGVWSLPETVLRFMDAPPSLPGARVALPTAPGGAKPPAKPGDEETPQARFGRELTRAMEPLPAAAIAVQRQPDRLTLEIRQPQLRNVAPRVIDIVVQWWLEEALKNGGR